MPRTLLSKYWNGPNHHTRENRLPVEFSFRAYRTAQEIKLGGKIDFLITLFSSSSEMDQMQMEEESYPSTAATFIFSAAHPQNQNTALINIIKDHLCTYNHSIFYFFYTMS